MNNRRPSFAFLFFLTVILPLAACGGGGGSTSIPATPTATISGSVYAAPVSGASVVILDSSGTRTIAGPVTTAADGRYAISVPADALSADLLISASSGTFDDEATGSATRARNLAAFLTGGTLHNGSFVGLDPSSTVVASMTTNHGKTFTAAQSAFASAFGSSSDSALEPRNAPYSASCTTAQRVAALRAMAFSQLTKDLGQGPDKQFELLDAIADDLADDGNANGSTLVSIGSTTLPEDIQNRFERALVTMLTNTAVNLTGLTSAEIGPLPFGKVALTNTYRVEYLPEMMPAAQGRTSFKIKVSMRADGLPASGLAVSLMPVMHMPSMGHATPVDAVTDNGDGTYSCTVYYLMASGSGMGYWELKVQIGGMMGETATFFPAVGMAMGANTVRGTLKGQSDIISSMTGTEKRSYYLFSDGLTGMTGNHAFDLFIAAKQSMMSYPAIFGGAVLTAPTGTWTVDSGTTSLSASTDLSTWTPGIDDGGGHWTIPGLTGLVSGTTGTIYVKLKVNGEDKTTDGNAASGANAYAAFTVMP